MKSKISIVITVVALIALCAVSFFGYNAYSYKKVESCINKDNFPLALSIINSADEHYKDLTKIKELILTVQRFDENDTEAYSRTISKLESFESFESEAVNRYYFDFYNKVKALSHAAKSTAVETTTTEAITIIVNNNTTIAGIVNNAEAFTEKDYTTVYITEESIISDSETVYYVADSEVYHLSPECSSLSRSKNIYSGPVPNGRRVCKLCGKN